MFVEWVLCVCQERRVEGVRWKGGREEPAWTSVISHLSPLCILLARVRFVWILWTITLFKDNERVGNPQEKTVGEGTIGWEREWQAWERGRKQTDNTHCESFQIGIVTRKERTLRNYSSQRLDYSTHEVRCMQTNNSETIPLVAERNRVLDRRAK